MRKLAFLVCLLSLFSGSVSAQTPYLGQICINNGQKCSLANNNLVGGAVSLPVTGTFSATLGGFAPASVGTPITATTGGATGTLPAGTVVVATNVGTTNGAYCALGASSTTAQQYIAPNGGWFAFTVGVNTQLTCITSTSTTTINMVGGSGLATGISGTGGGGSSGGQTDEATFTYGTTTYTPIGGVFNNSIVSLTSGQGGALALTADRNAFVNLNKYAGTALGAPSNYGTSPGAVAVAGVNASVTTWAGTALGAMANYGTSPGAVAVPGTNAFITNTVTVSATNLSTNLAQVNGVTVLTGTGATGTGSQRMTVAQDVNTIAGSAVGSAGTASAQVISIQGIASMTPVQVSQATAASLNATIVGTGTAGSAAGGILTVQGVASMTPFLSNPGTAANWGVGATGSATPANAISNGFDAQSAEPSKATTGNLTAAFGDLTGKLVTSPYANRENMVRGSASATGTGATTLIAAGGASVKTYVTDVECGRSDAGTSAITVTFSDAAATILVLPNSGGGGGNNKTFNVPLVTAANTAFTFTSGTSTTTVFCSAQGFSGY